MPDRENTVHRAHDHLVEPLFAGLREARGPAPAERGDGGAAPEPILERSVPSWWLWSSLAALLAGALWLT